MDWYVARLRRLADCWCADRTIDLVIEPTLTDVLEAWRAARHKGWWHYFAALAAGHVDLLRVFGSLGIQHIMSNSEHTSDHFAPYLYRVLMSFTVATLCLSLGPLRHLAAQPINSVSWFGSIFLQSATMSIPVGLGITALFPPQRARLSARQVLLVAVTASAMMFVSLGWALPSLNRAARLSRPGMTTFKAETEVTISQLRRHTSGESGGQLEYFNANPRVAEIRYQSRFALAAGCILLSIFGVAVRDLRRPTRLALGSVAFAMYIGLTGLARGGHLTLAPAVAAWVPSLALLPPSVFMVLRLRKPRRD
jgi:hypothetical protein